MESRRTFRIAFAFSAMPMLLLLLTGCGGGAPEVESIRWPPPPAKPVIVFDGFIRGSQDLPRGFWARLSDSLFGQSPDRALGKPYGLALVGESKLLVADTATRRS